MLTMHTDHLTEARVQGELTLAGLGGHCHEEPTFQTGLKRQQGGQRASRHRSMSHGEVQQADMPSEICRLPARCFLGVCPQDPPGGMDGNGKAAQSPGTPTPPVMLPVLHTPTPNLRVHASPHTSTCTNMHTRALVTGISRATSQAIPPQFFPGPSRTPI